MIIQEANAVTSGVISVVSNIGHSGRLRNSAQPRKFATARLLDNPDRSL